MWTLNRETNKWCRNDTVGSGFQPGEDADALLQGEGKGSGFQPGEDEMEEMASEQAEAVAEQRAQAAAPASSQTPHPPAAAPGAGEDAAERRRHLMHGDDYPPGFSPLHRIIIIIIIIIIISFYLRISSVLLPPALTLRFLLSCVSIFLIRRSLFLSSVELEMQVTRNGIGLLKPYPTPQK